ncbi:hypothetical protein [Paracoccus beibuensis]|uniref:hypothetical protein n=1 Tax=Paracoccus beibuensis TaxID=547602 RepID=UPI00223F3D17|nr:hypothetical protein [Paracoccus beibuensis]
MRIPAIGLCSVILLLSACGDTTAERAATGGVAGAVVGGPVGAAVGGTIGATTSAP